ncbi:MAG: ATP-binding cassette domain-containing protein [Halosimplex sp.]
MPAPIDDPVLEVEHLSAAYRNEGVLDRLDLRVECGDRLGIVGESASGKTTLATALVDGVPSPGRVSGTVTHHPESGDPIAVFDLGEGDRDRFRRESITAVSGDVGRLDPTATVDELFEPRLRAVGADEERAADLLAAVGLDHERVRYARPGELNAGGRQIARAVRGLLTDPAVLVLDGLPLAIDHLGSANRIDALAAAATGVRDRTADTTVVALGSDLPSIAAVSDRLAVLYDGRVVEQGPTERVVEDPHHPHTRTLVDYYGNAL